MFNVLPLLECLLKTEAVRSESVIREGEVLNAALVLVMKGGAYNLVVSAILLCCTIVPVTGRIFLLKQYV